ncbi:MAG: general secretion pathway protein A, partial [Candidatus Omnitrophota bacterium]
KERKGILVVTGEVGTGKTTLCRTLLNQLSSSVKTAFILNPNFSDLQLLKIILKDLDIQGNHKNKNDCIAALNKFLIEESSKGNNVAIIIDEAQNLGVKQLEQVRLLSNLETEKDKLLQIILIGQPELDAKLKLPQLRQLNQRVTVRFTLQPLKEGELKEYINHRIDIACGFDKVSIKPNFTDDAVHEIYEHSKGTPRMVNILCDRALLAGFIDETNKINQAIIRKCAEEII